MLPTTHSNAKEDRLEANKSPAVKDRCQLRMPPILRSSAKEEVQDQQQMEKHALEDDYLLPTHPTQLWNAPAHPTNPSGMEGNAKAAEDRREAKLPAPQDSYLVPMLPTTHSNAKEEAQDQRQEAKSPADKERCLVPMPPTLPWNAKVDRQAKAKSPVKEERCLLLMLETPDLNAHAQSTSQPGMDRNA